jgi:hypothetical protein
LLALIALIIVPLVVFLIVMAVIKRRRELRKHSFSVRVAKKVDETRPDKHPFQNEGSAMGYEVRAPNDPQYILGRELWLVRTISYTFRLEKSVNIDYPVYISTSDYGGGNAIDEYLDGVRNSPAYSPGALLFTPPLNCPDVLFYQCSKHKGMGYRINIVDSEAQIGRIRHHASRTEQQHALYDNLDVADGVEDDEDYDDEDDGELTAIVVPTYRAPPAYNRARHAEPKHSLPADINDEPNVIASRNVAPFRGTQGRVAPAYVPPPSYGLALAHSKRAHRDSQEDDEPLPPAPSYAAVYRALNKDRS